MVRWPPSPIVEDEVTALAKEHGASEMTQTLLNDDQLVPSRGEIDQYPIILDSDASSDTLVDQVQEPVKTPITPKQADQPCVSSMFRPETGLPTPPASDSEARDCSHLSKPKKGKDTELRPARSKSATRAEEARQPRSPIYSIETDVAGDLHKVISSPRRAPSPYSYTRESGTFRVDHATRYSPQTFLSPACATLSPVSIQSSLRQQDRPSQCKENDSSTDCEAKPKKSLRFAAENQISALKPYTDKSYETAEPGAAESNINSTSEISRQSTESNDSRRARRQSSADQGNDVPREAHRSRSRTSRASSKARESPYSSSAEESGRNGRYRSTKKPSYDEQAVRRRSSHRREDSRLDDLPGQPAAYNRALLSDDEVTRRVYRVRDGKSLMMHPPASTQNQMEDYFSRAFQENALKPSRYTPRSSVDETAISPTTSPPQTPRSEQPRRQEYFEPPLSSPPPHRSPGHSRGASLEAASFRDTKAHTSLLSQATSAAAVLASRTGPPVSRSATNAIEATFACSANALPSKPRSRASSPHRESIHRSDTWPYSEQAMAKITYPPVPQPRPTTRDGLPKTEVPAVNIAPSPRNASWTPYEPRYAAQSQYPTTSLQNASTVANTLLPAQLSLAPPVSRPRSATVPQEPTRRLVDFTLPPCPRSQATQGHRDWITIQGIPNIDVCPTCAQAVSNTRFRSLLQRSLDKPYDKWTVCSFSRPWARIAFTQSLKLNKPDLALIKTVSVLPEMCRPCKGSNPDVRIWWNLIDPDTNRPVPDFYACNACIRSVHFLFPDLPDQFQQESPLQLEQVCTLHQGSKQFNPMIRILDEISEKCRERRKNSARYIQPFADYVRRMTRYPECKRDMFLTNRAWHFMEDLPEFTICDACYENVVMPQRDKSSIARDISMLGKVIPSSAFRGSKAGLLGSGYGAGTQPVSCQLYSDRMRRIFADVVDGRMSFEAFKSQVKERQAAQYRLAEINKMYEEDQKIMGWDRRADIERNRAYWRSLE